MSHTVKFFISNKCFHICFINFHTIYTKHLFYIKHKTHRFELMSCMAWSFNNKFSITVLVSGLFLNFYFNDMLYLIFNYFVKLNAHFFINWCINLLKNTLSLFVVFTSMKMIGTFITIIYTKIYNYFYWYFYRHLRELFKSLHSKIVSLVLNLN